MGESQDAAVNNLVAFLSKYDGESFNALSSRYPESPLMREGRCLGQLPAPMATRVDIALSGLDAMTRISEETAQKVLLKIRSANRWELCGQLISLLGSGGVLAVILARSSLAIQVASAAVAFAGSAIALYVKFLRRDVLDSEKGLLQVYGDLIRANSSAVELYGRLLPARLAQDDFGDPRVLNEHVDKANALAASLYQLVSSAGEAVSARMVRGASVT